MSLLLFLNWLGTTYACIAPDIPKDCKRRLNATEELTITLFSQFSEALFRMTFASYVRVHGQPIVFISVSALLTKPSQLLRWVTRLTRTLVSKLIIASLTSYIHLHTASYPLVS